jgi:Ca-activated chloride channel family protein
MLTILLSVLMLWTFVGTASAQQPGGSQSSESPAVTPPPGKEEQGPPIRVLVEEVNLQFTVSDNKNHLITDLNREDFQVREENKPQVITAFSREADLPLRIGLLIDTSNSIRDRFEFEQRASSDFLRALLRPGKDKAFLASFDSIAELVMDFTDDLDKLVPAIQSLRSGGGTSLYDAIFFGARDKLLEEAPPTTNYRRSMVVVSDGEDNQSRHSRQQALEMAQRAEVTIYTISTNMRGTQMAGDKVLQGFADDTGGRYFQPSTKEDLEVAFRQINADLRSQYTLSYRPTTPRDGRYHDIEVVTNIKGVRVRSRRGYYATHPPGLVPPPDGQKQ